MALHFLAWQVGPRQFLIHLPFLQSNPPGQGLFQMQYTPGGHTAHILGRQYPFWQVWSPLQPPVGWSLIHRPITHLSFPLHWGLQERGGTMLMRWESYWEKDKRIRKRRSNKPFIGIIIRHYLGSINNLGYIGQVEFNETVFWVEHRIIAARQNFTFDVLVAWKLSSTNNNF